MKKIIKWVLIILVAATLLLLVKELRPIYAKRYVSTHIGYSGESSGAQAVTPDHPAIDNSDFSLGTDGQLNKIGDWYWDHQGLNLYAGVDTSGGRFLLKRCAVGESSCTYIISLFTGCDAGEFKSVVIKSGGGELIEPILCGEPTSDKSGNLYYIEGDSAVKMGAIFSGDRISIGLEDGHHGSEFASFSLDGADEIITLVSNRLEALKGSYDAMQSIPALKEWSDNESPELARAIDIDDEMQASGKYSDLTLRERYLIVVDRVKRESQ